MTDLKEEGRVSGPYGNQDAPHLTASEAEMVRAIMRLTETYSYPPTKTDLAAELERSGSGVDHTLSMLERKGYLRLRTPSLSRGLVLERAVDGARIRWGYTEVTA